MAPDPGAQGYKPKAPLWRSARPTRSQGAWLAVALIGSVGSAIGGRHHVVDRWSPDDGVHRALGLAMVAAAGLDIPADAVY